MPAKKKAAAKRTLRTETMEQTRAALVAAAESLFAEEGLDASLDAICERAGYTRGAFYVHFADRDALLVAVMETVGARFLAQMFASPAPAPGGGGALASAAARFVGAVEGGSYPLMSAESSKTRIRFHQLLDACARSPKIRAQYRGLVEASIEHVASLALLDRMSGALRPDLDPTALGKLMLATIIGAQTMAELGVLVDAGALAKTMLASLSRSK
ncbi:MAG: helix-turn-helix domain-containing protein [Labilithrix sp.]